MHRVLPDPALSLAFYCRRVSGGTPIDPRLMIIGPKTRPHIFPFRGGQEIAAVRVKLEWSALLLDLVPEDHRDREHPLSDVLPRLARELLGPLTETRSAGEAAGRLAELVVFRGRKRRAAGPGAAAHALDLVRQAAGRVSVDGVARRMGVPSRTLRRTVRREAGLSLKEYARVTRFLRAVVIADRSSSPAWAAIAADAGFCDQSHLVRECRALTGLAPGQVHRERRAQADPSNTG
jgi:AraC-like DNA-binding protein